MNYEEADTRMFLHAKHAAIGGRKSINIVSSDTDVVVIGVAVFDDLNVDHLWMTFGKGKDLRWVPIHDTSNDVNDEMLLLTCGPLPFDE
jgi:hypothetical protein